ncbi:MAG TPA: hypothetical protein VFU50_10535 [Terriglobales bacterium]|nr:hypothetical protein [Terriglobales bacterium]
MSTSDVVFAPALFPYQEGVAVGFVVAFAQDQVTRALLESLDGNPCLVPPTIYPV